MTTALALSPGRFAALDRGQSVLPSRPDPAFGVRNDDPRPAQRGGPLLDDVISGAWGDLVAHHTVACPVCTGPMAPRYGSGARPVGGRCRRCGSTLG